MIKPQEGVVGRKGLDLTARYSVEKDGKSRDKEGKGEQFSIEQRLRQIRINETREEDVRGGDKRCYQEINWERQEEIEKTEWMIQDEWPGAEIEIRKGEEKEHKIVVVGDSLLRDLEEGLQTSFGTGKRKENRTVTFIPGGNIEEIRKIAEKEDTGAKGGIIVIQGGGNGLINYKSSRTWENIERVIRQQWWRGDNVIVVVGVTRRTREGREFENERQYLNVMVERRIQNWWAKERDGTKIPRYRKGVIYVDVEDIIEEDVSRDGVHLTKMGKTRFHMKIVEEVERIMEERMREERENQEWNNQKEEWRDNKGKNK